MSDLGGERFVLAAAPPVRAVAIAAAVAVVGAMLTVGSRALGLGPVALVTGVVGLLFAAALMLAVVILVTRVRSTLLLDAHGITVIHGQRTDRLSWSEINSVKLTGRRLTLVTEPGTGAGVSVINPGGRTDPTFLDLIAAIRGRLNADRGYRTR